MEKEVWFLIIGLVGGAIVSLIVNYFTEYTASPLANRYSEWRSTRAQAKAKKSVESAIKHVDRLENRLKQYTHYANNSSAFVAYCVDELLKQSVELFGAIVLFTTFILILNAPQLPTFFYFVPELWILIPLMLVIFRTVIRLMSLSTRFFDTIGAIRDFEKYKTNTEKQIAELQEVINQRQSQIEG